jgi:hypothetical protein
MERTNPVVAKQKDPHTFAAKDSKNKGSTATDVDCEALKASF